MRKQLHTAESRAKFLKRFDANGDGKVPKEEAKAVLAAEAKKHAAEREKRSSHPCRQPIWPRFSERFS